MCSSAEPPMSGGDNLQEYQQTVSNFWRVLAVTHAHWPLPSTESESQQGFVSDSRPLTLVQQNT